MLGRTLGILVIAGLGLTACGDVLGPEDGSNLSINFSTAASAVERSSAVSPAASDAQPAGITGTNGTLVLDDVRLIVAEFKLERTEAEEDACEEIEDEAEQEACEEQYEEEYEAGPYFLQVPLDGGTMNAARQPVPAGEYAEFKFEVEDIDLDEVDEEEEDDEDDKRAGIQTVVDAIAAVGYDDWPADASMVVTGSFTPEGGTARPFKAYFEAEVKVEMEFPDPLVVTEDESSRSVTIQLDPAAWFTNADGTVIDLSEYDYTGSEDDLFEFEVKMEDGFTKIELDD